MKVGAGLVPPESFSRITRTLACAYEDRSLYYLRFMVLVVPGAGQIAGELGRWDQHLVDAAKDDAKPNVSHRHKTHMAKEGSAAALRGINPGFMSEPQRDSWEGRRVRP